MSICLSLSPFIRNDVDDSDVDDIAPYLLGSSIQVKPIALWLISQYVAYITIPLGTC